jgi:hypothetical protein
MKKIIAGLSLTLVLFLSNCATVPAGIDFEELVVEEYNLTAQYPSGWRINSHGGSRGYEISSTGADMLGENFECILGVVMIDGESYSDFFGDIPWEDVERFLGEDDYVELIEVSETTISGLDAKRVEFSYNEEPDVLGIFVFFKTSQENYYILGGAYDRRLDAFDYQAIIDYFFQSIEITS